MRFNDKSWFDWTGVTWKPEPGKICMVHVNNSSTNSFWLLWLQCNNDFLFYQSTIEIRFNGWMSIFYGWWFASILNRVENYVTGARGIWIIHIEWAWDIVSWKNKQVDQLVIHQIFLILYYFDIKLHHHIVHIFIMTTINPNPPIHHDYNSSIFIMTTIYCDYNSSWLQLNTTTIFCASCFLILKFVAPSCQHAIVSTCHSVNMPSSQQ